MESVSTTTDSEANFTCYFAATKAMEYAAQKRAFTDDDASEDSESVDASTGGAGIYPSLPSLGMQSYIPLTSL